MSTGSHWSLGPSALDQLAVRRLCLSLPTCEGCLWCEGQALSSRWSLSPVPPVPVRGGVASPPPAGVGESCRRPSNAWWEAAWAGLAGCPLSWAWAVRRLCAWRQQMAVSPAYVQSPRSSQAFPEPGRRREQSSCGLWGHLLEPCEGQGSRPSVSPGGVPRRPSTPPSCCTHSWPLRPPVAGSVNHSGQLILKATPSSDSRSSPLPPISRQ